jgi:hypothetical protein
MFLSTRSRHSSTFSGAAKWGQNFVVTKISDLGIPDSLIAAPISESTCEYSQQLSCFWSRDRQGRGMRNSLTPYIQAQSRCLYPALSASSVASLAQPVPPTQLSIAYPRLAARRKSTCSPCSVTHRWDLKSLASGGFDSEAFWERHVVCISSYFFKKGNNDAL